jgi:hypothetical protein
MGKHTQRSSFMKKNTFSLIGIMALVAVIGLGMTGCDDGTTDGGGGTTYSVSFDAGNGSGTPPASQAVNAGSSITLPSKGNMTAPSGQNFSGWRTGGQDYAVGDSYTVNANTTFTAQWTGGGNDDDDDDDPAPSAPPRPSSVSGSITGMNITVRFSFSSTVENIVVEAWSTSSRSWKTLTTLSGSATSYNISPYRDYIVSGGVVEGNGKNGPKGITDETDLVFVRVRGKNGNTTGAAKSVAFDAFFQDVYEVDTFYDN